MTHKPKKPPRSQKPTRDDESLWGEVHRLRDELKRRRSKMLAAERERDEARAELRSAVGVIGTYAPATGPIAPLARRIGDLGKERDEARARADKEHQAKVNEWGKREEAERERDEARERVQELELALREVLANCGCEAGGGARSPCSNCLRVEAALGSAPRGPRQTINSSSAESSLIDEARGPREPPLLDVHGEGGINFPSRKG